MPSLTHRALPVLALALFASASGAGPALRSASPPAAPGLRHIHHGDVGALPDPAAIRASVDAARADGAAADPSGRVGAGPRAVAHYAGGRRAPARFQRAAPRPRLYRTGNVALEPTMGVDPKGRLFVKTGMDNSVTLGGSLIRSEDGGRTWTVVNSRVGSSNLHAYTEDPYLYVDPTTGRVFDDDLVLPCQVLSMSDDAGATWTSVPMSCDQADHQTIFGGPPALSPTVGYPNVVYDCAINGGALAQTSTATTCEKSLDGGATWAFTGAPAYVADPTAEDPGLAGVNGICDGGTGHGYVDPAGTVYLPRGWCGQPWLATSKDEGATWTRVRVAGNGIPLTSDGVWDHEAAVASDGHGHVYYAWIAHDRLPHLSVSRDGGATWSKPMMIGPPGIRETSLPSLAMGADGRLALLYMGSTNSPGAPFPGENGCPIEQNPITWFQGCSPETAYLDVTWNGYLTVTANAGAARPLFYTASVNDPADPLVKGTCGPIRCQQAYDFLNVQIGPDGTPWGVYVDGCIDDTCTPLGEGVVARLVGGPKLGRPFGYPR